MHRLLILLTLPLLIGGCFMGKSKDASPLETNAAQQITVGSTTKAEVLDRLGPPNKILKLHESEAMVYEHVVTKNSALFLFIVTLYRTDRQKDAVTVIIDKEGIVSAVGAKAEADEASFGSPWGS
jgi:hypothetical protein